MPHVEIGRQRTKTLQPGVQEACVRIGGLNPYGRPNYRLVWGWDRQEIINGKLHFRYDAHEGHLERWHLERWLPAETFGTPESWEETGSKVVDGETVNVLGPYPAQGDYERILVFENFRTKEYVEPELSTVEEAILGNLKIRERTKAQHKAQVEDRMERRRKEADARMDEAIEENLSAFAGKTWMPVSGPMTPETHRRSEWSPLRAS
jgi:hypothetical protein